MPRVLTSSATAISTASSIGLSAVTVGAAAGALLLAGMDQRVAGAGSITGAAFGVTGALLVRRSPRPAVGWLLITAGLSLGLASFCGEWARYALVADPGSLPAGEATLWLSSWVWVIGYCTVASLLPLRLPDGAPAEGRWRLAWWAAAAVTVLAPLGWAVTPYDRMDEAPLEGLLDDVESPAALPFGPTLLAVSLPLLLVCAFVGLISLGLRWRSAVGAERQQLKWVVYGVVLTSALLLAGHLVGPEGGSELLLAISVLPLPAGIAVATLRYRLWDVDLVINRTLVYTVLTTLVIAVYAAVVVSLGDALGRRTGAPLLATVVVALGAEPARRHVQRLVDRLTRGDRADPYRALVVLGRRLEAAAVAPVGADVLAGVAQAVRQALQLPWVAVDVLDGPYAVSGTPGSERVVVPLVHLGEPVGELVVGPRRQGRPLSAADLRLLDDLARHVAVAAHAAQLRDALQTSRERLVSAREVERRRLRHDLHDDLGPVLAAVALQLGEIRSLSTDETAESLAARAETLVTGAVGTVRRIVDGLRPATLDELGLEEALLALADGFATGDLSVGVEVRGDVGDLPAAVEVAALRVATEAVHNAARHSSAGEVRVAVERVAGALEVTVADDGRGIPTDPVPGVGLLSMRERAEELGGSCTVAPGPGGGTVVMVSLPLHPAPLLEEVRA